MSSSSSSSSSSSTSADAYYAIDDAKLDAVRAQKAWMSDAKYFQRVHISPSATIKMMMHGQSGVEKGIKQSGKPLEVMGLLLGRPCTEDPRSIIITDAQALPIEGFETRVVADDEAVLNYMIALQESYELSRKERFCGWYHTHPFDVDVNSHCFLSNTDITTQLQWQRGEDPHGNPFVAIVLDPLRSLAKNKPELAAFRVFPPDYTPPQNQTPDGTFVADDRLRVERWGACWNRYYKLETSFFMSRVARQTLSILKDNFLWHNSFTCTPMLEPEQQQRLAERVGNVSDKLDVFGRRSGAGGGGGGIGGGSGAMGLMMEGLVPPAAAGVGSGVDIPAAAAAAAGRGGVDEVPVGVTGVGAGAGGVANASQGGADLAVEQLQGIVAQLAKNALFGSSCTGSGGSNSSTNVSR
jgi:COP9 signalosome complex subunit 5